jgi:spermidine/putrescine transport system substrate-binding protein
MMKLMVDTIWRTGTALLVGALVLTGCGGGAATTSAPAPTQPVGQAPPTTAPVTETPSGPGTPLSILEWSGYEATSYPQYFAPFTDKYGDQVNDLLQYTFFADDAEAFTKAQSGFHADIVHPCNSWFQLWVDRGLMQPIDTSRLSNWSGVDPRLAALGQINGKQYFVPWDWGFETLLVRNDLVPKPVTSWADVWDPAFSGHIAQWDNAEAAFIDGALALGFDPWNTTPDQQQQVQQKLIDLKSHLLTYWKDYTESYELPTTGDSWILMNAWQDAYSNALDSGYDVSYITPTEGRLAWVCGYGITSDATNLDLAYELIDAGIAPESMAAMADDYAYGFSNMDAVPLVTNPIFQSLGLGNLDTLFDNTVFYKSLTEEQRQMMSDVWNQVKAAP